MYVCTTRNHTHGGGSFFSAACSRPVYKQLIHTRGESERVYTYTRERWPLYMYPYRGVYIYLSLPDGDRDIGSTLSISVPESRSRRHSRTLLSGVIMKKKKH